MLNFRRTASADAINTGAKGWVRSDEWVDATNAKELLRDTGRRLYKNTIAEHSKTFRLSL